MADYSNSLVAELLSSGQDLVQQWWWWRWRRGLEARSRCDAGRREAEALSLSLVAAPVNRR
jgi:hypothetical protein